MFGHWILRPRPRIVLFFFAWRWMKMSQAMFQMPSHMYCQCNRRPWQFIVPRTTFWQASIWGLGPTMSTTARAESMRGDQGGLRNTTPVLFLFVGFSIEFRTLGIPNLQTKWYLGHLLEKPMSTARKSVKVATPSSQPKFSVASPLRYFAST